MAAAMAPTLPAVREEEDETTIVEFGNTELHRQAAHKGKEKDSVEFISVFVFVFLRCESFEITSRKLS